ncbi:PH domain-containing protein [Candidatus Solincola tengchongensis]|uniref:PH domain-containing protein n=1 Tax=Candidatus Solincola tengchongensis TaxID=2900693 RepID=UPI00257D5BA7|nr:PH domain-containing protein [Candidatus Solincola tengchongensis]
MGETASEMLESGEEVVFDRRHSLWEIWRNFLAGIAAVVALVLLLTRFKPGPSSVPGETNWGYIALIGLMALLSVFFFALRPLLRQRGQPDKKYFLPATGALLTLGGWSALMWFRNSRGFAELWTLVAWAVFAVVMVGWLLLPLLRWYFTHFILTDRKLILSSGVLNKQFKVIPLDQVNDISGSQNVWERIFNYGDLVIESAGEFGQQPFTNIGNPREVRALILERRNAFLQRRAAGAPTASPPTVVGPPPTTEGAVREASAAMDLKLVEGLRKLDELRRSGALTEEEFQRAKKELLEKLEDQ